MILIFSKKAFQNIQHTFMMKTIQKMGPEGFSVQFSSVFQLCLTLRPCGLQPVRPLTIPNSWNISKLVSIESVMPSNGLVLFSPLLLLPSIFPSIRVFSNQSALRIRWPKYWNYSSSISPSNEYSGLISFLSDCFDFLAVQGSEKTIIQTDICSLFIALTRQGAT